MANTHQAAFVELPTLVAARSFPLAAFIVAFVGKTHRDAVVAKCPEFLDRAVVVLVRLFAREECEHRDATLENSERLRQRLSSLYASATFSRLRPFQPSSAARTFFNAVSSVSGGRGGRVSAALLMAIAVMFADGSDDVVQQRNIRDFEKHATQLREQAQAIAAFGRIIDHYHHALEKRIDRRAQIREMLEHIDV